MVIKYQREINTLYHRNQAITLKYPEHPCHQPDAVYQFPCYLSTYIQDTGQWRISVTIGWDKFSLKCINSPLSLLDGVGIDLDVETHNKVRPAPGNQVLILIKRFTFIRFSSNLSVSSLSWQALLIS